MKKLMTLIILVAAAVTVSSHAYAYTPAPAGFGYGVSGFGYNFGGFGYGMNFAGGFGYAFGGFGGFGHGMDFTVRHAQFTGNKIVPLLPTASVATASITYDENGELHVRPFDDEDLFVED